MNKENENITVCICDDTGVHYPCSVCGKLYNDELDAVLCCSLTVISDNAE